MTRFVSWRPHIVSVDGPTTRTGTTKRPGNALFTQRRDYARRKQFADWAPCLAGRTSDVVTRRRHLSSFPPSHSHTNVFSAPPSYLHIRTVHVCVLLTWLSSTFGRLGLLPCDCCHIFSAHFNPLMGTGNYSAHRII